MAELERTVGKASSREEAPVWVLVVWPLAAGFVALVGWVAYALIGHPPFGCDNGTETLFSLGGGGDYKGGAASNGSLGAAAVLGFSLWLVGSVAIWRFGSKLTVLFAGFVLLYVVGLLVLGSVASLIWGPRLCV